MRPELLWRNLRMVGTSGVNFPVMGLRRAARYLVSMDSMIYCMEVCYRSKVSKYIFFVKRWLFYALTINTRDDDFSIGGKELIKRNKKLANFLWFFQQEIGGFKYGYKVSLCPWSSQITWQLHQSLHGWKIVQGELDGDYFQGVCIQGRRGGQYSIPWKVVGLLLSSGRKLIWEGVWVCVWEYVWGFVASHTASQSETPHRDINQHQSTWNSDTIGKKMQGFVTKEMTRAVIFSSPLLFMVQRLWGRIKCHFIMNLW